MTHPNVLSSRKWVIEMLPAKPFVTAKKIAKNIKGGSSKVIHKSEASQFNLYSNEL